MFQFPALRPGPLTGTPALTRREVAPFGYLGLAGCTRLPLAFRGGPRPSSPRGPEASPVCVLHRVPCVVVKNRLVGPGGIEPPPSRLSGARSPAELGAPRPRSLMTGQSWHSSLERR